MVLLKHLPRRGDYLIMLLLKLIEEKKKKILTRTGVGSLEIGVRTCSLRYTANLGL
jgi:hypothetical protein